MSCYRFIDQHAEVWPVTVMCEVLEVSRSGFYDWRGRGPSDRASQDAKLGRLIELIHDNSGGTYGAPRIHATLARKGVHVGRKRVARLMRQLGIQGVGGAAAAPTTTVRADGDGDPPAPDLVDRDFDVDGPDQLWCADITYVDTDEGWLYVAVIIDAFSRRVVGWSMADHLRCELALDALDMAVARRQPTDGLVHHSDQGIQYAAGDYHRALDDAGIAASMGAVGCALDNALVESMIGTLKVEFVDRRRWPTRQAAKTGIFRWIEHTYNRTRIHSSLGYLTPAEYELAHQQPDATVAHAA